MFILDVVSPGAALLSPTVAVIGIGLAVAVLVIALILKR